MLFTIQEDLVRFGSVLMALQAPIHFGNNGEVRPFGPFPATEGVFWWSKVALLGPYYRLGKLGMAGGAPAAGW